MNQTIIESEKMVKDARKKFICKKIMKGFLGRVRVGYGKILEISEAEKKRSEGEKRVGVRVERVGRLGGAVGELRVGLVFGKVRTAFGRLRDWNRRWKKGVGRVGKGFVRYGEVGVGRGWGGLRGWADRERVGERVVWGRRKLVIVGLGRRMGVLQRDGFGKLVRNWTVS